MTQRSYLAEQVARGVSLENIGPFDTFMYPYLMRANHIPTDERVVDIGAGQGHFLISIHAEGWRNLVAVDLDDRNFSAFQSRYSIETHKCDVTKESLDLPTSSVGLVSCMHIIEHLLDPSHLLAEVRRILKPGGHFFLITPDWRKQYLTFYQDPTHVRPYDKEALSRLFRMHGFEATISSWNTRFGLARVRAYQWFPRLGMIGSNILVVGKKLD